MRTKRFDNTSEVSSFSVLPDIAEAIQGKYAKFEGVGVNFVIIKSVGFLSVPTLETAKTVKIALPNHYACVAFVGGDSDDVRTHSIGEDENLEIDMAAGESLFVFFNLRG